MHPILQELGLSEGPPKKKTKKNNNGKKKISALDVLQQLLTTNVLTADQVKNAYSTLSNNSNGKDNNKQEEKKKTETHSTPQQDKNNPNSDNTTTKTPALPYRTRHIALRVYYEGKQYTGLAQNVGDDKDQSVERHIFAALTKTKLIPSRDACGYSRCGRTDKGVSAVGQVLALRLKSAIPLDATWDEAGTQTINDGLPKHAQDKITVWVPPKTKTKKKQNSKPNKETTTVTTTEATSSSQQRQSKQLSEYPYEKMLNSLLPLDIRILAWSPVSDEFSARFSASTRTYRYFFHPLTLNLEAMRQGLARLVGKHDFRNFCKLNVVEVSNFVRTIHSAKLVTTNTSDNNSNNICYFEIQGQAFLWHQIRCIVSVMFLIGRGLEEPTVVTELLDIETHPGKPSYPLAPEYPLVLHECGYPNLQHMGYSVPNLWVVSCQLQEQWETLTLEAARIRNCLQFLASVNTVRKRELAQFAIQKLTERHKKQQKRGNKGGEQAMGFVKTIEQEEKDNDSNSDLMMMMDWKNALEWLAQWKLVPDSHGLREHVHIPLLERSKGTTYEEKIDALQQSTTKRSQQYKANVAKKRKAEDGDSAFYEHMLKQGGSAID
ncbi:pseudouridine(38/39) synthase [Seminavis robusta]|uniref:Pseudouridine(38/39) synthase n=1 Tax=Seminavis robusta TaxID=568900 RepID=A0A9N8DSJ7_9STRA|nr:pseudouridine(38/39) synthase [Seminavis robusta]|eukprot:Sro311_g114410.1 pseudouridine(38/39) synthase (604) ;mRNA; f:69824-71635